MQKAMLDEYLGKDGSPVIKTEEVCAEPQVSVHGRSSSKSNEPHWLSTITAFP